MNGLGFFIVSVCFFFIGIPLAWFRSLKARTTSMAVIWVCIATLAAIASVIFLFLAGRHW